MIKKYEDRLEYYTFNIGDKEEVMQRYLNNKQYPFQPYRIDNKNVEKLAVDAYPTYMLVDGNKKVILRTSDVGELESFFQKMQ